MTGGSPHHYYDSFAQELTAKFRRVGYLVSNRVATGDYHEEILRAVLRNFLSKRFSVKTGFVLKNETEVSNQVDIIIVDEYDASAYIYQEGDFAIVRPGSVVAVIEVKTKLDMQRFDEALKNVASVKCLATSPEKIRGMIFGYDSTEPSQDNLDGWFKRQKTLADAPRFGPTLISFFKHNRLLLRLDFDHESRVDESDNYHLQINVSEAAEFGEPFGAGWQLRIMLALIYLACMERDAARGGLPRDEGHEIAQLLMLSGGVTSTDHYEFGTGFVSRPQ